MSMLLENRDYVPDGAGSVRTVEGAEAVLSEALFRLTARRGGFAPLPELGSRMYRLREERPSRREALARQYAAEALAGLEGASDITAEACMIRDVVLPGMEALRAPADQAETLTAAEYWPFPTYGELLFGV